MAVPTTTSSIRMSDIYAEANGGGYATPTKVSDLFKKSYFEGPAGSGAIGYNCWGQYGATSGADKIFGLGIQNTSNSFSNFSGLTYFYDNGTYNSQGYASNSMPAPNPFPPGINNDVTIDIQLLDSTYTYVYAANSANCNQGASPVTFPISFPSNCPIIDVGYWSIRITTNNSQPIVQMDMNINGGVFITNAVLPPNSSTGFDSSTYGTAGVAYNSSGSTGLYFEFNFHP